MTVTRRQLIQRRAAVGSVAAAVADGRATDADLGMVAPRGDRIDRRDRRARPTVLDLPDQLRISGAHHRCRRRAAERRRFDLFELDGKRYLVRNSEHRRPRATSCSAPRPEGVADLAPDSTTATSSPSTSASRNGNCAGARPRGALDDVRGDRVESRRRSVHQGSRLRVRGRSGQPGRTTRTRHRCRGSAGSPTRRR